MKIKFYEKLRSEGPNETIYEYGYVLSENAPEDEAHLWHTPLTREQMREAKEYVDKKFNIDLKENNRRR